MSFWIIFSLFLVAGGILEIGKVANGKKRRSRLVEAGRTSTWEMVKSQTQKISRIVQTDFGYGREVWVLPVASVEINRRLRAFASGILVLPRPKLSDLQEFCDSHEISLELMMVK